MTDNTTRTVTSADFFIKGAFPAGANFTFAHDDSLLRVSVLSPIWWSYTLAQL